MLLQMIGQQVADVAVVVDDQQDGCGDRLGHGRSAQDVKLRLSLCLMAKARRIQSDTILTAPDTVRHPLAANPPDGGPTKRLSDTRPDVLIERQPS
ncbi:hypothetical protein GCM10009081_04750 [Brevundimonas nasdae]